MASYYKRPIIEEQLICLNKLFYKEEETSVLEEQIEKIRDGWAKVQDHLKNKTQLSKMV